MEFNLLYLKYLFILLLLYVPSGSLETTDGGKKFVRKKQPVTFECPAAEQDTVVWKARGEEIKNSSSGEFFKVNVIYRNILTITLLRDLEQIFICETTNKRIKFVVVPIFNDNGNLFPSSETPNAINDQIFTLKCKTIGGATTWYTGNGTFIAKYYGKDNQNKPEYFVGRQKTNCTDKICTLSITDISLEEDNMSIICDSGLHSSMFNITVFVLPKTPNIKSFSDTDPVENHNKTYQCLIKETHPEFSVFWLIINKDGTKENATEYISNMPSKSGKLTTLSSKLTLTLNKQFKALQCVAYFPGKMEFNKKSSKLDLQIKYSPEKDSMTLNVSPEKVCINTETKFQCSWKGGDPPASVTLMYKNKVKTGEEVVEVSVTPTESHLTVKCLGIHIAANVSREKNLTIFYPPDKAEIMSDEPFLEDKEGILHCQAKNGYPEEYSYRWDPNNSTSQNLTLSKLNRRQNNKIFTCYVSNICTKKELGKKHWLNVEYSPDITASDNITLTENEPSIIDCNAEGNPVPEVKLECGNQSFSLKSQITFNRRNVSDVFCVAIAKSKKHENLKSRKKINVILKYPPQVKIHISNDNTNTITINCTAFDGYPQNYKYKLKQKWGNSTKNTFNMNLLTIKNIFNNTGTWECHVRNDDFNVVKSSSKIIPVKPIFSPVPNNQKKKNASVGESVNFEQCFYSHPKSDVTWRINDKLIDSNKYSTTDYLSSEFPFKGNCTNLTIKNIKDNDFGTYTLTVENTRGKSINIFTLRSEEIHKTHWKIIIGCTVGVVVILIIIGLVAYKFCKRKAPKCNNEFSSTKGVEDNYATISNEPHTVESQYDEISDPKYLEMKQSYRDGTYVNVSKKPGAVESQYDEISDPKYLEMKHPYMDGTYVNASKKPTDMDGTYVNASKKPGDMDGTYVNASKKPAGFQ